MHQTLTAIQQQLEQVIARIQSTMPNDQALGIAHGNWSFPGLSRDELVEEVASIIELINERGGDDVGGDNERLKDYVNRLAHLHGSTIPQLWGGNAALAVAALMFTLNGLRKALAPVLTRTDQAEASVKLRKLTTQLRSMEARLKALEPRSTEVATMVDRIERAYHAADQLPTDLESLAEAKQQMTRLIEAAVKDQANLVQIRKQAAELDDKLNLSSKEADAVLERCETAYSAATSVGLAAAFSERAAALSKSMWIWVIGLVLALGAGSFFGSNRLNALSELLKLPEVSPSIVALNLFLSLLSVGAPVWFAWMATKQIGQRFRLSEDYAFKASISRAYEGFRREAARVDKEMEAKLLASALARFDELPLRLVENTNHGSPWHELASSEAVQQALKSVPGFAEHVVSEVKGLAGRSVGIIGAHDAKSAVLTDKPEDRVA